MLAPGCTFVLLSTCVLNGCLRRASKEGGGILNIAGGGGGGIAIMPGGGRPIIIGGTAPGNPPGGSCGPSTGSSFCLRRFFDERFASRIEGIFVTSATFSGNCPPLISIIRLIAECASVAINVIIAEINVNGSIGSISKRNNTLKRFNRHKLTYNHAIAALDHVDIMRSAVKERLCRRCLCWSCYSGHCHLLKDTNSCCFDVETLTGCPNCLCVFSMAAGRT